MAVQEQDKPCARLYSVLLPGYLKLRLIGGRGNYDGTVEVYDGATGNWGTICDKYLTDADATVMCKMLGFQSGYIGLYVSI